LNPSFFIFIFFFLPRMANMTLIPSKKGPQISEPTFSSALSSRRFVISSGSELN
jgi:hypothetical protein